MSPGGQGRLLLDFAASVAPLADDLLGAQMAQWLSARAAVAGAIMAFCIAK